MKIRIGSSARLRASLGLSTIAGVALGGAAALLSTGCQTHQGEPAAPRAEFGQLPAFAEVVSRYNVRAEKLGKLWARAVIRLTYKDEKGTAHTDQGEGLLQMSRPDRVALSIKKAGRMLFWFGCDAQRYWFFDVVEDKIARVGSHARPGEPERTDSAGIAIPPRELFELIGMAPLDAAAAGRTAWSPDGSVLLVTIPDPRGGVRVVSLDPSSLEPRRIERRTNSGRVVLAADLKDYEGVELAGVGGLRPRLATHIDAAHAESDTRIRLDLSEMRDSGLSDKAFVFEELCRALGAETIIDVDRLPPAAPSGVNK